MTLPENSVAFVHRSPSEAELTRFRLLLSTFQDGTGQGQGGVLPGWRDFERAVALTFGGIPSESKNIMDVRLPDPARQGIFFGLSCKMRDGSEGLRRVRRKSRVTIELSNAAKAFQNKLESVGLTMENFYDYPQLAGRSLIELVGEWHTAAGTASGGNVDLTQSYYLTLMWDDKSGDYQLHQFPIGLPDPSAVEWHRPMKKVKGGAMQHRDAIVGDDDEGTLFEWYGQSGGQLKYYPRVSDSVWQSEVFELEPLPSDTPHGLISKAESYYPNLWPL